MSTETYQTIIIGAGQGGALAKYLAQAGQKVALIERRWLGGSCINWGCTPSKTMISAARVAHVVRRAAEYGVLTAEPRIDLPQIRARKRGIVHEFRDGYHENLQQLDTLEIICGEAKFCGEKAVRVEMEAGEDRVLRADKIVIATGTCPAEPPIPGLREVGYLTSETAMELETVPEHLLVLGGGYIAVEFSQMFRRFGARVTMLEREERLLSQEDPDVSAAVQEILEEDGIEVFLGCEATRVSGVPDLSCVTLQTQGGEQSFTGSHLLLAAGQKPNTAALNLEVASIETDEKQFVRVNDRLETNVSGVYALGDVKGGLAFTHVAFDDARILRANLLEDGQRTTADRVIPWVVFIDPQLGRVGLSEKEALAAGYQIRVAKLPVCDTARGIETNEMRGFLKAIVDVQSEQILGGVVLAAEGGEVLAALQVAMLGKLPYTALRDGIFSHPTQAESFNNLFLKMDREG